MSKTHLTQQLRRTFFSPTLENSSPCLDTSPQILVGGSIDEASPRISTQLRWSFGVRRWISNPRLFSLTQRGAAWRTNKSQCGWQGDCTFQLQRSGVGLAPDHQMLQADGQGGGAGFWLFLRTTGEPIQRSREPSGSARLSVFSGRLAEWSPDSGEPSKYAHAHLECGTRTRQWARPAHILLSTEWL